MLFAAILGAALLAGAAFVFGAWFGHRAGGRAQERAERELARIMALYPWNAEREAFTARVLELVDTLEDWPDPGSERYAQTSALCVGVLAGLKSYARELGLLARRSSSRS